jgi:hypothetical protein
MSIPVPVFIIYIVDQAILDIIHFGLFLIILKIITIYMEENIHPSINLSIAKFK